MTLTALLLTALLAAAPTDSEISEIASAAKESAEGYADCAGFWDYMASTEVAAGRPKTGEQLRNLGNGAQTTALWLYANAHTLTGGKPVRYGTWLPLVSPRREAAMLRASAAGERSEQSWIKEEGERCLALIDGQKNAIDSMRADSVQQAIDEQN